MAKRVIQNLDLKIKLTNEYLRNGGVGKIFDPGLLDDLINTKFVDGKADPDSVTTRMNAFMIGILHSHLSPPFYSPEHISEYASTLQKAQIFEQENIDTVEQFDKIYEEFKNKDSILFRGQREAKWRLYSKLQRQWILEKLADSNKSYQSLIERLVAAGLAEYAEKIKELFDKHHIDINNDIAVLGFLQHHGCPTPLLDWTYKFQNALFFGLDGLQPRQHESEIEDYFSVYYLEEEYFEDGSMRKVMSDSLSTFSAEMIDKLAEAVAPDEQVLKEMREKFKDRSFFDKSKFEGSGMVKDMAEINKLMNFPITYFSDKNRESGIIFSLNNSKNILNQVGVFTWNADPSKPLELMGNEQYKSSKVEEEPDDYRFCKCFNIHKSLEGHIRNRLTEDGITKEFIYPSNDIDTCDVFEKNKKE
jgi:hypothetical protein